MKHIDNKRIKGNFIYPQKTLAAFLFIIFSLSSLTYCPDDGMRDPYLVTVSGPITVTLTYKDKEEEEEEPDQAEDAYGEDVGSGSTKDKKYGADGLTGNVNKVTKKMGEEQGSSGETKKETEPATSPEDEAEKEEEKESKATLTVSITSELRKNSLVRDSISAKVIVNNYTFHTSGDLDEETSQELRIEAENFVNALNKWHKLLSRSERKKLRAEEKLSVDVKEPYNTLNKFKGDQLTVPFVLKAREARVDLNFVQRYKNGFSEIYRIPRGEPFWVEAKFSEPPEEDEKTVTMSWAGSSMNVKVTRTREMSTLYRSLPFVIEPLNRQSTYDNH